MSAEDSRERPVFPYYVPNFPILPYDQVFYLTPPDQWQPGRGGHRRNRLAYVANILALWAVWQQKTRHVVLSQNMLAGIYYGARPYREWRRMLQTALPQDWRDDCCDACPDRADLRPHKHLYYSVPDEDLGDLGVLFRRPTRAHMNGLNQRPERVYAPSETPDVFRPDLRLNARSDRLVLDHIKCKQGALGAYLPGLLFGRSPLVGWSETQVRTLQGIIREQTRAADDFLVVDGARYPWLTPGRQYASFNNNFSGRWHGAGYRIMSRSKDCWLYKAGYGGLYNGGDGNPAPIPLPLVQRAARLFFCDLARLADDLDLTVVATARNGTAWKPLGQILAEVEARFTPAWLDNWMVRIYAPVDCWARWRKWFASKLGYAEMPDESPEEEIAQIATPPAASG